MAPIDLQIRPRLLLVEDDEDTRALLAVALENDGWRVDQAADAFQGLELLRRRHYDVLVADYDLPGKTGAAMIREASDARLLEGARVVVVTAHPDPRGLDDLQVIRKPLDLPSLLEPLRGLRDDCARRGGPPASDVLELVLYVSARSMASARAAEVLRSLIPGSAPGVTLTICDLTADPGAAEQDNVVFTPTLVKRGPPPRTWILGDLTQAAAVAELLQTMGIL
jgi:CheY-like chemotaxis protein